MSEVVKTFKYGKSGKFGSLILLASVILITIGFSMYDFLLKKEITNIQNQIVERQENIKRLEGQKNVNIYSLIKKHTKILDELDKRSHITKYMDHLTTMAKYYKFEARGFNFSGDKLTSRVTFINDDLGLAYKKSANFISEYRNDETAMLDLEFVGSIRGTDNSIIFPVDFTLKK